MKIIKVQYLDGAGEYSGREYSYFSEIDFEVGEEIIVPARHSTSLARVSQINVPEDEVAAFADRMKTVTERKTLEAAVDNVDVDDPLAE